MHHLSALQAKRAARKVQDQIETALKLMLDEGFTVHIFTIATGDFARLAPPKSLRALSPFAKSVSVITLSQQQIQWMLSEGLVRRVERELEVLPEARSYLRRKMMPRTGQCEVQDLSFIHQHQRLEPAQDQSSADLPLNAQDRELFTHATVLNRDESPLAWLARRKEKSGAPYLEHYQVEAGERLRRDFTFGQVMPATTTNWSLSALVGVNTTTNRNGIQDLQDAALSARQRFQHAMAAVGGDLSGILVDVCCFTKGLDIVERERQWPSRSAKLVLKFALNALAKHYGMLPNAYRRPVNIMHWGVDGYRPNIE